MPEPRRRPAGGVLVCEPQFRGSTHATFNAALLAAAARAFPEEPLAFAAHPSHLEWVFAALSPGERAADAEALPLPPLPSLRRSGRPRRTAAELRVWLGVLALAHRRRDRVVLFTSTTKLGALLLKIGCAVSSPRVLAVVHQLFELVASEGAGRSPSLATVFALPQPVALSFVAPSSAVGDALASLRPRLARRFVTIEPPYFWQREQPPSPPTGSVGFGLFGCAGASRLEPFLELARRVGRDGRAHFRILGYIPESIGLSAEDAALLGEPARRPVTLAEMTRRADEVSFSVWLGGGDYRLRLSASFLDSLSHLQPLIALRTPFAEHYFQNLGDIGILCEDLAEMGATMHAIAERFPEPRYRAWCANMLAARRRFDPATVAESLALHARAAKRPSALAS